ncbi:hypothetical protein PybrP1_001941, partial [[Pythium] brassicae (nom. inval.)]
MLQSIDRHRNFAPTGHRRLKLLKTKNDDKANVNGSGTKPEPTREMIDVLLWRPVVTGSCDPNDQAYVTEVRRRHRLRWRLRRERHYTERRVANLVNDMHQKLSIYLAVNYSDALLPALPTSVLVRKVERAEAISSADSTTASALSTPTSTRTRPPRRRVIRSSTARMMLAQ